MAQVWVRNVRGMQDSKSLDEISQACGGKYELGLTLSLPQCCSSFIFYASLNGQLQMENWQKLAEIQAPLRRPSIF